MNMGMDLLGEHGSERFSARGWRECLERAIEFGWTPEGTVASPDFPGDWQGGYGTNDWQLVTDSDARGLGEALLRAAAVLSAVRANEIPNDKWPEENLESELDRLRTFANFAIKGGFIIA